MEKIIGAKLEEVEKKYDVSILLAIESGSRAWGFPSEDSDYDVRFIYAHRTEWYLSVFEKRDVIELPITDPLWDINGWDLRKALQLLRKSNPALMEWLISPLIYRQNEPVMQLLRDLAQRAFMPEAACYHYLSMAKGHLERFARHEEVKIKSYLYSLRPVLCCRWVIEEHSQPPMLFSALLARFLPEGLLRLEIDALLILKRQSGEVRTVPHSPLIEGYIEEQIILLQDQIPKNKGKPILQNEDYDTLFREMLSQLS